MIPVISWLTLNGKCRKCKKPIGYLEPIMEVTAALFFVGSFIFWPYQLTNAIEVLRFVIWLSVGVGLFILFAYDQMWSLLPDKVNYFVIGLGGLNSILVTYISEDKMNTIISIILSISILSGIYWVINRISDGKWIGYGDVKLGLGLGLLLADWRLAFIALFAANLVGSLVVIPLILLGKLKRNSKVPFGPLMIIGFIFAGLFGGYIVQAFFYGLI